MTTMSFRWSADCPDNEVNSEKFFSNFPLMGSDGGSGGWAQAPHVAALGSNLASYELF